MQNALEIRLWRDIGMYCIGSVTNDSTGIATNMTLC